jgi:DNA-directed RNA polymerase subunit beta'
VKKEARNDQLPHTKPEKDGLFGADLQDQATTTGCSCGKQAGCASKESICGRCIAEVTKSSVRRERMGHIELFAPVTHLVFQRAFRRACYLLDMARDLERSSTSPPTWSSP